MGFEHAWYMVYQYSKLPLIQSWQDTGILLNDMRDQPQKRVTKWFKSSSRLLHQDSLLSFLVKTCPWKHAPGGAYRPEYATPNEEQRHSPLPLHSGTADPRWVLPGLAVRRVNEEKGKQARTCCMLTPDILHSHIKQLSAPIASDFHLRKPSENFSRGTVARCSLLIWQCLCATEYSGLYTIWTRFWIAHASLLKRWCNCPVARKCKRVVPSLWAHSPVPYISTCQTSKFKFFLNANLHITNITYQYLRSPHE